MSQAARPSESAGPEEERPPAAVPGRKLLLLLGFCGLIGFSHVVGMTDGFGPPHALTVWVVFGVMAFVVLLVRMSLLLVSRICGWTKTQKERLSDQLYDLLLVPGSWFIFTWSVIGLYGAWAVLAGRSFLRNKRPIDAAVAIFEPAVASFFYLTLFMLFITVVQWLRTAVWMTGADVVTMQGTPYPKVAWLGVQEIIDAVLRWPAWAPPLLLFFIFFVCWGVASARRDRRH